MVERDVPIMFPLRGLDESQAEHAQPPLTTEEAVNVRGVDPTTGRITGAQRMGTVQHVDATVFNGSSEDTSVREVLQLTYDSRLTTFAAITSSGSVETVWSTSVPALAASTRVVTDYRGNVYALSGRGAVAIYNPHGGDEVAQFEVPLDSNMQRVRALAVDDIGGVYTGVTYSPGGSTPKVFRHQRDLDGKWQLAWALELEGTCPDLVVRNGLLFLLENVTDTPLPDGIPGDTVGVAYLRCYGALDASEPLLLWEEAVAFPASGLSITAAGKIMVSSYPNGLRTQSNTRTSTVSVDWEPTDLDDWDVRGWTWLDARSITGVADGSAVEYWEDRTGNNRNLFFDSSKTRLAGAEAPLLDASGLAGFATVSFNGDAALTTADQTGEADNDTAYNFSLMPTVNGKSFTLFMLMVGTSKDSGKAETVLHHRSAEFDLEITANQADSAGGESSGTVAEGNLRADSSVVTDGGGYSSTNIAASSFKTDLDASLLRRDTAIVVFRHGGDDASEASKFRVNGVEVDAFTLTREQGFYPSMVGRWNADGGGLSSSNREGFMGHIAEIICVLDNETPITDEEIENFEGYLAHRWGVQHNLDEYHPYYASPPGGGDSVAAAEDFGLVLRSVHGIVAAYGPESGRLRWAFAGAGVGYAVEVDVDGDVYNIGTTIDDEDNEGGEDRTARKLTDEGNDYAFGWVLTSAQYPAPTTPAYIEVDLEKNVFLPVQGDGTNALKKITAAGSIEWTLALGSGDAYDIALDPIEIDYGNDAVGEQEFAYVTVDQGGEGETGATLYKIRLVSRSTSQGSVRETVLVAVCGGDIRTATPPSTLDTPTGGDNALVHNAPVTFGTVLFGQAFFTDGVGALRVYDPVDDAVVEYKPTSLGEFPRRPLILERWRGALVGARFDDNPNQWFLTERGDPYDVDLAPPVPNALQAILGSDSRAGLCPDIINCVIPYNDDLAVFGGDHTIHRLTGDPIAGGQFDLVTDETGIAFGRPWCKDPEGMLYFMGSRGDFYRWGLGGPPENMSEGRIGARLRSIDLSEFTFRLVWNERARGVEIFVVPLGIPSGEVVTHYFWERPTNAFYETTFSNPDHQPTCATIIDGDEADDRAVVIGCADGFLRRMSVDALDDDGTAIATRVLCGPYERGPGEKFQYDAFLIKLRSDQGGAWAEIMASDAADELPSTPAFVRYVSPGEKTRWNDRVAGQAFWMRFRSATVGRRWSFEAGSMRVLPLGGTRP